MLARCAPAQEEDVDVDADADDDIIIIIGESCFLPVSSSDPTVPLIVAPVEFVVEADTVAVDDDSPVMGLYVVDGSRSSVGAAGTAGAAASVLLALAWPLKQAGTPALGLLGSDDLNLLAALNAAAAWKSWSATGEQSTGEKPAFFYPEHVQPVAALSP